jgi:hypothetical protein
MVPFKKKKKTIFIPFLSCKHVQVVVIWVTVNIFFSCDVKVEVK